MNFIFIFKLKKNDICFGLGFKLKNKNVIKKKVLNIVAINI